jgi:DNA-binding IclR family transcriptional regulator
MARQSPAVGRIVSILNFFVEHPDQAFTLTQIVKSLRLSRATCHALLVGLVEAGYLYRRPDKSYVLGPALISLAVNAQQHFSPLAVARQEMRMLADELDVVAAALFREGDEVVVRERATSLTHLSGAVPAGQRYPLHPWGSFFLVPLPDGEFEDELAKATPPLSEEGRENVRQQMRFARRYGFVVAAPDEITDAPRELGRSQIPSGTFLDELEPEREYRLNFLVAPVMNERARVAFGIALSGFTRPLTGVEIVAVADRLREACRRITTFIAGKQAADF